jgi:hypothetical protein
MNVDRHMAPGENNLFRLRVKAVSPGAVTPLLWEGSARRSVAGRWKG